ncbi:bifunctional serine/threonine-protein kinase/NEDD4-like E3 ubiquitin-protein ligase isoform X2 [Mercenaria mercenaria]|uniref:bifunctional serine/threonine-protein kinase/NEDD4-like E3 ubiquitin-protein ligase isoform X2 n=1 Tax=Mercenaria mercenaria TaxID=6596 RepID=UPI00234FABAE|nr:bifunctional serine/threonine-protein kinase/NEDD4-like E3 ubiquitin-protein ligase isoform X2 [Mercenaria mercenaria]
MKDILHFGYSTLPPIREEMQTDMKTDTVHYREDATGHMLCWGCGEFGQHGHGYKKEVSFLDGAVEKFCGAREHQVKHVGCGSSHTAVVTRSNELYLWGNGNSGQLGTNDLSTKLEPQKLPLYTNQDSNPNVAGVSCGGRHTVVWLENGNVFSFGNNFHAQLGYDFRQKNYKENQTQPTLLKFLLHKPVSQVACGDKHTIFRFQDGGVACVGNNAHGQIGTGDREEAVIPKFLEGLNQQVKDIAAGSQHSLAVTNSGEIYVWGYGRACGSKTEDVLEPVKLSTHRNNVIAVAGGSTHSMALTANGSVYTWGYGHDGQLGHGEKIKFLTSPKRVKDRHVTSRCIQISCGEAFSAAVTEKGLLYMWGKNSHTILPDKPTSYKIFLPHGVNKNFRGGRISNIFCGSWHAIAIIGRPELLLREDTESGESADEQIPNINDVDTEPEDDDDEDTTDSEADLTSPLLKRDPTMMEREKTTVSIADFYAPTPDINKSYRSPSPEFYFANENGDETDRNNLNSTRSAATLIVQLPVQPMTSYADAATSPMTLTTTTSSTKSSSVTTLSRVPSPVSEIANKKFDKIMKKRIKPEKKFKEFDPQKYEREKLRSSTTPVSEVVQLSKTPADAFILPRETTGLSRKHVDFSEMEEIRLKGPRSPEKLSRLSRHKESREPSPSKFRELSPSKFREPSPIKLRESGSKLSRHRYLDTSLSLKSDITFMESPLFRSSKKHTLVEKAPRLPETPYTDERQYTHHVPKQQPRKYNKQPQVTDSNFGLQISRSRTVIAPVPVDNNDPADRLAQLRRYAAIHNPTSSSGKGSIEKLRPIKNRHVSIPGVRAESPDDEKDQLCIGGALNPKDKPVFSSGSTWRDRTDLDRLAQRKMAAAGIVKMYIGNHELVGTVENPLYTSISDGRGHSDPIDSDTLIVQPLLKKRVKHSEESINLELPSIAINQTPRHGTERTKLAENNLCNESEELDLTLTNTSRTDKMIGTRVS